MNAPLSPQWLDALSLTQRGAPDFYRQGERIADVPHAAAMRLAMEEMGVSAIHCIQGVPTIAFAVMEEEDSNRIDRLHAGLWNQGLMSLLLVIVGERLLAYSLARKPVDPERRIGADKAAGRRLLETLTLLENALELRDLVSGVESGRLVRDRYAALLDADERVDGVLLGNLMASHHRLCEAGMAEGASQALLMQVMFVAYLEERGILTAEYFREATDATEIGGLRALLHSYDPSNLHRLFRPLHEHFNGDLFHSPCAFGPSDGVCTLTPEHMRILEDFIWGEIELDSGQRRFWSYQFRYIPVELVSAVYDRMLADDAKRKKADGAYYTPMFLADLVVDQVWGMLSPEQRHSPQILDPACGSGIFLVRLLDRLVEHRRAQSGKRLPWQSLKALAVRLHGWDRNALAVRIAVFSLYLAMLEQRQPREIRRLMAEGKLLPSLWGRSLRNQDFFSQTASREFDVVVGNPPWNSRKHKLEEAVAWCGQHGYPIPQEQSAWGFVWKAREHVRQDGIIAFLVPAMGFLHNDASVAARRRWLSDCRIERLINFADLRHLLFDGAKAACLLATYRPSRGESEEYRFDYWCPKGDLNIQTRRLLTVSHADMSRLSLTTALADVDIFKRRLWMGTQEARLHGYLASFRRLGAFISRYKEAKRGKVDLADRWIIGQGFSAAKSDREQEPGYARYCPLVAQVPFLDSSAFRPGVLPRIDSKPWNNTGLVHRERFSHGFIADHVLIPQGIGVDGRVRAAYDNQNICHFDSIQSVKFPRHETSKGKLLAAALNSRVIAWFLLHEAGAVGIEIPKVHEDELLLASFPEPDDLEDPEQSRRAMNEIVAIMDDLLARRDRLLDEDHWPETIRRLDELVFAYYGLNEEEIAIVEETFEEIIPAIQPNKGRRPRLWNDSSEVDQARYLRELESSLGRWMLPDTPLQAEVLAQSKDAAVVRIHLGEQAPPPRETDDWSALLDRLWGRLDRPVSRNLQIITDLRLFDGDDLYLFKPRKRRFWLRTTAMNDAAAIAGELCDPPEESAA